MLGGTSLKVHQLRARVVLHNTSARRNRALLGARQGDHCDAHLTGAIHVVRGQSPRLLSITAIDRVDDGAVLRECGARPARPGEGRLWESAYPVVDLTHEMQQHLIVRGFADRLME